MSSELQAFRDGQQNIERFLQGKGEEKEEVYVQANLLKENENWYELRIKKISETEEDTYTSKSIIHFEDQPSTELEPWIDTLEQLYQVEIRNEYVEW